MMHHRLEEQHTTLTAMRAELHAILLDADKRNNAPVFVSQLRSCLWYMDAALERLATLVALEVTP